MKKGIMFLSLLIISMLLTLSIAWFAKSDVVSGRDHAEKTISVLVKFKRGVLSNLHLRHSTDELNSEKVKSLFRRYGINTMSSVFSNRYDIHGKLKTLLVKDNSLHMEDWQKVELRSNVKVKNFLGEILKNEWIETAQLDEPIKLISTAIPNDPYFNSVGQQWYLDDGFPTGQSYDIDAPKAWDINKGRSDVVIAVLDGGVDYGNQDLDPGDRSRVIAGTDVADGDNDPIDDLPDPLSGEETAANHGTPIAGIIGAITNNNNQVAGILWNCKIMPVKIFGTSGVGINIFGDFDASLDFSSTARPSDVIKGIDYAVNNGANIVNMSFGFYYKGFPIGDVFQRMPAYAQAVKNAYLNNVVVTAAMGNNKTSERMYPAGFDELVIPVGATDLNGVKTSFSNFGSHISVVAPGTQIYSTSRRKTSATPITFSGTSFSAPIVAGVAGLILSQGKDRNFNLTNNDTKHIIEMTAQDVGNIAGFDNDTGYGIVNANNALKLLAPPNVLYHYTSTGGTATKVTTLSKWEILDSRWGLSAGLYLSVDQYKITKHIDFAIPFCSTPKVWIRERESKSLDYGSPNSGRPNAFIKNITASGFDLEYVAYYVGYDVIGRQINQWVPTTPSSTVVAYTAVGNPNLAAVAGPISGSSLICGTSSFTIANNSNNLPITWSSSNPSGLSISASGVATRLNNFNGTATISAVVTGNCGAAPVMTKAVRVGTYTHSDYSIIESRMPVSGGTQYLYGLGSWMINDATATYNWSWRNYSYISGQGTRVVNLKPSGTNGGYVGLSIHNACGWSDPAPMQFFPYVAPFSIIASPNPVAANSTINLRIMALADTVAAVPKEYGIPITLRDDDTDHRKTTASLFDFSTGNLIKQWTYDGRENNYALNINGVKPGTYVLKIGRDGWSETSKIIIE
jgi:subtilisin family serine protease